jgi:hypothetical protein
MKTMNNDPPDPKENMQKDNMLTTSCCNNMPFERSYPTTLLGEERSSLWLW